MFLTDLAKPAVYTKPVPKDLRGEVVRNSNSPIHYVQRPSAQVTACGKSLDLVVGVRFTVDRNLLADQCPTCREAAWLPTKENAMTRAGIDCRLYPSRAIFTT